MKKLLELSNQFSALLRSRMFALTFIRSSDKAPGPSLMLLYWCLCSWNSRGLEFGILSHKEISLPVESTLELT